MLLLAKDYRESRRLESGTNITLPWIFFYHGSFSSSTIPHYDPINQSKFKEVLYKKELGGQCVRRTTTIMLVGHKSPPSFRVAVIYL